MMKKYRFALLTVFVAMFAIPALRAQSNCYVRLTDASGYTPAAEQIAALEQAAAALCLAFDSSGFGGQFKVYDFGFYQHHEATAGGYPEPFARKVEEVAALSSYYLLFGKQSDRSGVYTRFWVDTKLPITGVFSCLTESKLTLIKEAITLFIEEKYSSLGRRFNQYSGAEIADMGYLKSIIDSVKLGNCCPILPETIKNILLAKGYKAMPVNLVDKPPARPEENANRFPASVEDNANMLIEIPATPGFIDMAIALDTDVSFASVDDISAKAIITKNSNFCDGQIYQRVQNNFSGEDIEAFIHCHYWESPDTLQPDLLIAKIEYIPTIPLEEVVIIGQTGPCGAVQLPSEPGFYNYAITMDNGVYYGYNWGSSGGGYNWSGQWAKGDIVEYSRPNTYNTPGEIAEAEHMWANGGVEYNPFIAPYFLPSWRAYFKQKLEPTASLELIYHTWFTGPGVRLKSEREIAFRQFKYPDIIPPSTNIGSSLHWKCNSEVSKQIHLSPIMNTELVKIEDILKSWLTNHYNLDDLFIENINLFDNEINTPNLSSLFIPSQLALFGGTQGLKIQIRSLKLWPMPCTNGTGNTKHFKCEMFFTVFDNMGVGISDAKRWHPGLVEMWVLQHHRNYECDMPPCYIPITDHSAQIYHSFIICIGD